jgi:hypothetical protein
MIKRLAYLFILMLLIANLSPAKAAHSHPRICLPKLLSQYSDSAFTAETTIKDTLKIKSIPQSHMDLFNRNKIKEVAKPKHQSKPEKVVVPVDTTADKKAKRQRRPDGLERPPEIPRRGNN